MIRHAAYWGYLEIVKLLMLDPKVNYSDMNNDTIKHARSMGNLKIVELLLTDPRVN